MLLTESEQLEPYLLYYHKKINKQTLLFSRRTEIVSLTILIDNKPIYIYSFRTGLFFIIDLLLLLLPTKL